jgi:hypothetical protein
MGLLALYTSSTRSSKNSYQFCTTTQCRAQQSKAEGGRGQPLGDQIMHDISTQRTAHSTAPHGTARTGPHELRQLDVAGFALAAGAHVLHEPEFGAFAHPLQVVGGQRRVRRAEQTVEQALGGAQRQEAGGQVCGVERVAATTGRGGGGVGVSG